MRRCVLLATLSARPACQPGRHFDAAMPLGDSFECWMPLPRPAVQAPIGLYSKTLQNCLPGNWRMIPFISRVKSVARTSDEFKPERSTRSSMCTG